MKRGLILGIGALTLAGMTISAGAADMPVKAPPVAAPPPPFSWSGCYIGANVGAKWGSIEGSARHDALAPLFPAGTVFPFNSDSETGFIGGGQVGCQWQTGSFVWGIEGDFVGTDISRDFIVPPGGGPLGLFLPGDAFSISNDWQASIRGRLGWAWDRFMIYATGGVAWANFQLDAALVGVPALGLPALFVSRDKTLTGFTVGGGFEYAFTPNWSVGVEYRFSQFDGNEFGFGNRLVAPGTQVAFGGNADLETQEVTARLNYRFNLFGFR
jgi:outer membrane immunogenic protein